MAEENSQNRRYPQNLQGLLQLAVDAGSAAEGPAPAVPMSEEVKKKKKKKRSLWVDKLRITEKGPFWG